MVRIDAAHPTQTTSPFAARTKVWAYCVLLSWIGLFACTEIKWSGGPVDKTGKCNPGFDERIKGTRFWNETFGKQGLFRARGCFRVSWGPNDDEGTSVIVEIHRNGKVFGKDPNTGEFTSGVSFTIPRGVQSKTRTFWIFVFGSGLRELNAQEAFCRDNMSLPAFRCEQVDASQCIFSWVFRPENSGGVETAPIGNDPSLRCRLVARSFVSEGIGEPLADAGIADTPLKEVIRRDEGKEKSADVVDAIGPGDVVSPRDVVRTEPSPQDLPLDRQQDTGATDTGMTPELPPNPLRSMAWCGVDKNGMPLSNQFYQPCPQDTYCYRNACHTACRFLPPKACPTQQHACKPLPKDGVCLLRCAAMDDFSYNYDPKCPVGYVCEGALHRSDSGSAFGRCGPSPDFVKLATGTKLLGESCSPGQGCDGSKGFYCRRLQPSVYKCERACDPRIGAPLNICPAGQSCVVEKTSFLQGYCLKR